MSDKNSDDIFEVLERAAYYMDCHDALLALADRIEEANEQPIAISIHAAEAIRFMVNEGLRSDEIAPVSVVMPERSNIRPARSEFDTHEEWTAAIFEQNVRNEALDEVARLNAHPIQMELLRKLAHCTEPDCCIAYERHQLAEAIAQRQEGGNHE